MLVMYITLTFLLLSFPIPIKSFEIGTSGATAHVQAPESTKLRYNDREMAEERHAAYKTESTASHYSSIQPKPSNKEPHDMRR
jgi:hypothetical protein